MLLQRVSLCVDILTVENQWIVEVSMDFSIKVFFKMKKGHEPAAFSKVQARDKWTNDG